MTIPLFDQPPAGRARMPRRTLRVTASAPAWSRHTPARPARCDLCLLALAETGGAGPFPKDAEWKRRAAGEATLLCHGHAQEQRHLDRLPPLRGSQA